MFGGPDRPARDPAQQVEYTATNNSPAPITPSHATAHQITNTNPHPHPQLLPLPRGHPRLLLRRGHRHVVVRLRRGGAVSGAALIPGCAFVCVVYCGCCVCVHVCAVVSCVPRACFSRIALWRLATSPFRPRPLPQTCNKQKRHQRHLTPSNTI